MLTIIFSIVASMIPGMLLISVLWLLVVMMSLSGLTRLIRIHWQQLFRTYLQLPWGFQGICYMSVWVNV